MTSGIETMMRSIPLFKGLHESACAALGDIARRRSFSKGQAIFSEGEPGHGFFVVVEGRVKIFKLSDDGKEQILHIFSTGEPFGEVPVFTGRHFPAHAMALEITHTLYFTRKEFIALVSAHPDVALSMMAVLSHRLHTFTDLIEDLSLKEVPGRLAAFLLYQCVPDSTTKMIRLDVSRAQLASILGTIPETLSRIMARMVQASILVLHGTRGIEITDRKKLKELARPGGRLTTNG
jgi:CRP/FNR family transcriptional regulator, dissimilatory nitrate respiration regulator